MTLIAVFSTLPLRTLCTFSHEPPQICIKHTHTTCMHEDWTATYLFQRRLRCRQSLLHICHALLLYNTVRLIPWQLGWRSSQLCQMVESWERKYQGASLSNLVFWCDWSQYLHLSPDKWRPRPCQLWCKSHTCYTSQWLALSRVNESGNKEKKEESTKLVSDALHLLLSKTISLHIVQLDQQNQKPRIKRRWFFFLARGPVSSTWN